MRWILFIIFSFCLSVCFGITQNEIKKKIEKSDSLYSQDPHTSYSILLELEKQIKKQKITDIPGELSLYKGRYLLLITDYEAASIELNKAVKIFEKSKNGKGLARTYSLKYILQGRLGDREKGLVLLKKSLRIAKKEQESEMIIRCITNLAVESSGTKDTLAMRRYLEDLESYEAKFRDVDFYYRDQIKAVYYTLTKQYSKALPVFERARRQAFNLNMVDSKATIMYLHAECYSEMGEFAKAEALVKESYDFSVKNDLIFEEAEALVLYIDIRARRGDYKMAYALQEKRIKLEGMILNSEKIRNIKNEEYKQEIKLKENAITESNLRYELESISKKKYKNFFIFFLIISLLLAALVGGIWYFYKKIKQLNLKVNSQSLELFKTNGDLSRLNGLHEKIFSVISHDFKGPLMSMRLLIEVLKKQENESMAFYTSDIKNQLLQSELILQNLLDWAKSELKLEKTNTEGSTNVHEVIEEVKSQLKIQTDAKSLIIINSVGKNVNVETPEDILKIVFRNLLSNAIKYSHEGGKIECGLDADSEFYVKDFGKGISEEKRKGIFKDLVVSSLGTSLETGFGLGLYLTKEILEKVGGDIRIAENEEVGSRFCFTV